MIALPPISPEPDRSQYDVVIVGGAIMGSALAWFLTDNPDFNGSVLVIERDPTYEFCSTAHTNSCMRQQFSSPLNIAISRFAADFVTNIRRHMGGDERVPELGIHAFGYMYLADTDAFASVLRENQLIQRAAGAATQLMSPTEIAEHYPFYNLDGIVLGSINRIDEGYWDGWTVFQWWRRQARERGVSYITNEAVSMRLNARGDRVETVDLACGAQIGCGVVVNASGPRAAQTARMAGIEMPIEPRKRYSWIFSAERPLDRDLPLTIDPSGVHVRENGSGTYLAGAHAAHDPAVAPDDFTMDQALWAEHIWPVIAHRIPQFEAIKVTAEWVGHYAYNTLDQNAVVGPHIGVTNFLFMNGFSGHGLQQSAAMGRGLAEWITHGGYRTLDLTPFHYDRVERGEAHVEQAVI